MRTLLLALVLLLAGAVGAAFFFGLFTMAAERDEKNYVVRLVIHPDFMVPNSVNGYAPDPGAENGLEAKGKIVSVNAAKNELTVSANFKNLIFSVANDTMVTLNGQPAKLADLKGGDDATVVYTRQGQQLNATVVRCTRNRLEP